MNYAHTMKQKQKNYAYAMKHFSYLCIKHIIKKQ